MRRIFVVLCLLSFLGCGAKTKPVVFVPPTPLPLTLKTWPPLIQVYTEFKLQCLLPDGAEGTAIFGIQDRFHSEHTPLDKRLYERWSSAGCDPMSAYCGYRKPGEPKPTMTSIVITPIGECRE